MNFINRHKYHKKDFTRKRKLLFIDIFALILRKSVKSLQLVLNEFVLYLRKVDSVTSSAYTQARKKLKHTAFEELNHGIISLYYQEEQIKRFEGFRILGVDVGN